MQGRQIHTWVSRSDADALAISQTTALVAALMATQISLARAAETTVPTTATTPALPAWLARPATSDTMLPAIVVLHGCECYYGALADNFARATASSPSRSTC